MGDLAEHDQPVIDHLRAELGERSKTLPRYQALIDSLAQAILDGVLPQGGALPGERTLSEGLGLSRVTVRRAIEELELQGQLIRKQGARTTIASRVEKTLSRITGFSEDMRNRGSKPGLKWLSREVVRPTPKEVMALGISPEQPVVRLRRVRYADGVPIALERATIPQNLFPSAQFEGPSLYNALEAHDVRPAKGTQRIRAGVMSPAEAELLCVEPGTALLIVERRCTTADGRLVEFTETRYNGNCYDFVTDLCG